MQVLFTQYHNATKNVLPKLTKAKQFPNSILIGVFRLKLCHQNENEKNQEFEMLLGKVCTKVYDMPSVWYVLWSFSVSPTPVLLFQQRQNPKFRGELPHFLCSFKLLICDEHLKSLTRVSVLKFHLLFLQCHIGTFYSGWLVYLSISMLYVLQLCTLRIFYFQSRTSFS